MTRKVTEIKKYPDKIKFISNLQEVYSNQAGMKQHAGPSSKYGIPDKQNNWKTQKQPIPAKISKVQ
jgi:hypothetical protein